MSVSCGLLADSMGNSRQRLAFARTDSALDLDSDAKHNDCSVDYWLYNIYHHHSPMSLCKMPKHMLENLYNNIFPSKLNHVRDIKC